MQHNLSRPVDHDGEVLGFIVTKERDKASTLKCIKKALKRHGSLKAVITDGLRSLGATMKELGNAQIARWAAGQ